MHDWFTPAHLQARGLAVIHIPLASKSPSYVNKYFELKTRGVPMGHPKLELLASNGVATFVMPFSITLNARHPHIKQTHTCIHRHAHAQTHPHIIQMQTYTHTRITHTDTHTHMLCVCVCMCVHMAIHKLIHDHTMQCVAQLRALIHSDSLIALNPQLAS